jgi:hypothetical protein
MSSTVQDSDATPPVVVFRTRDGLLLADGYHRPEAARRRDATSIRADICAGSRSDALRYASLVACGRRERPLRVRECVMPYPVDFNTVSTVGLESSPVAAALAGLRAHEARYFKNKYDHAFTVEAASNANTTLDWVHRILNEERDIVISSRPLEATAFQVENIRIAYVFYESGLSINVMYTVDDPEKRAVGFKLSEGMEVPAELASRFKFASQKSKLAGTIRGSYFAFKNEY